MADQQEFIVFTIDAHQYAVPLANVERVLHAVEISYLPGAPSNILGVINFQGRAVPVVNTRRVLGQPEREIDVEDVLVLVRNGGPTVAMVADAVTPVREIPRDHIVSAEDVLAGKSTVGGVATDDEGLTVLVTVYKLLSSDEKATLQAALDMMEDPGHVG